MTRSNRRFTAGIAVPFMLVIVCMSNDGSADTLGDSVSVELIDLDIDSDNSGDFEGPDGSEREDYLAFVDLSAHGLSTNEEVIRVYNPRGYEVLVPIQFIGTYFRSYQDVAC